ncbi:MAG: alpha/beta fold hydrolase [Xanthomarina gelatinilytica]|uniref:alpha/beta fold hydrolase n=1 Tax=Xanthomarina gelatinilytica TaxID=1137281 RepID=UPI003A837A1E
MKYFVYLVFVFLIVVNTQAQVLPYEKEIINKERFIESEIEFLNIDDNISLSGTLLLPKKDFNSVVIIIAGSGKDGRNSHFILVENLLEKNIGVFRFDERGVGKSNGVSYSCGFETQSQDLFYAINKLRTIENISKKKIGVIGHSQGGLVSINTYEKYNNVDFLIQWSSPVEKNGAFVKYQVNKNNKYFKAIKVDDENDKLKLISLINNLILENESDDAVEIFKKAKKYLKKYGFKPYQYKGYIMPCVLEIIRQNNEIAYQNVRIPLLYIIGSKDLFVNPINTIKLLNSFNNENITLIKFENLNHFLNDKKLTHMSADVYEINLNVVGEIIKWINSIDKN